MTATDELRRLLDERGVEYTDAEDAHTQYTWWSDGDHEIAACNSGERLAVYNLTPAQAVEATLGKGGCEFCKDGKFDRQTVMMSNHGWQRINFCPNCGRKVVGA